MKTRMNLRTFAGMAFTAAAFVLSASSAHASTADVKSAIENLERLNGSIENSIRYTAPEVDEAALLDVEIAYNLEVIAAELDAQVEYKAPAVTEDIEDYEVKAAFDRLDSLYLAIDESIKF